MGTFLVGETSAIVEDAPIGNVPFFIAPSSSGLGHNTLNVETRVRISVGYPIAPSSNGRAGAFEAHDLGSIPSGASKHTMPPALGAEESPKLISEDRNLVAVPIHGEVAESGLLH